ncbi:hypothetical protein IMZ31_23545 (plasmid) [Pontibacillus sp. ALD_SL1]|uniref:hypothetical protein n=1 Tax=Pontibacillus sp. ALD_SL1 TaxID=2777185 RepID=UPI001A95D026|nr:hypothetical protein [Pontibacillus sp. ALD_SL1]QST02427.1 hypothetical protein IMZ31_23545 [Pontibacillus sp. ALD_SL1]
MKGIKLKDDVSFNILKQYGFEEDPANVDEGDTYYADNNYYVGIGDFRITVSTHGKTIDVLCLAKEPRLYNIVDLTPLYHLIMDGHTETWERP